jgi:hypothetical protein
MHFQSTLKRAAADGEPPFQASQNSFVLLDDRAKMIGKVIHYNGSDQ